MKKEMEEYFDRLWPLNRSLTGDGNRETLKVISELVDLKIKEVPSGTQCFDWTVPPEWNVKEAWIKDGAGRKIVDFAENNLHLMGYSQGFSGKMSLAELLPHLHSIPDQPDVVPYLTSYYSPSWGFCVSQKFLEGLKEGIYEVLIDASHNPKGSMTVAEAVLKGRSEKEILISTYICHPSMANNELSGPIVSAFLYRLLKGDSDRHFSVRFLYVPETIGAVWYLHEHGERLKSDLIAGYVLTCIGDTGMFTYKRSRTGNSLADRAAEYVLESSGVDHNIEYFFPTGSDERQYCSPGFNLPVGSLMRTRYGKYGEYHTSADNKNFISFESMEESAKMCHRIVNTLMINGRYENLMPHCEPQLGKRGLYPSVGSRKDTAEKVEAMMWTLNMSDGTSDLIRISELSGIPVEVLHNSARTLEDAKLLKRID